MHEGQISIEFTEVRNMVRALDELERYIFSWLFWLALQTRSLPFFALLCALRGRP